MRPTRLSSNTTTHHMVVWCVVVHRLPTISERGQRQHGHGVERRRGAAGVPNNITHCGSESPGLVATSARTAGHRGRDSRPPYQASCPNGCRVLAPGDGEGGARTHAHAHACTRAHTHTHTHCFSLCLSLTRTCKHACMHARTHA